MTLTSGHMYESDTLLDSLPGDYFSIWKQSHFNTFAFSVTFGVCDSICFPNRCPDTLTYVLINYIEFKLSCLSL